jgi:hypothetical protein
MKPKKKVQDDWTILDTWTKETLLQASS